MLCFPKQVQPRMTWKGGRGRPTAQPTLAMGQGSWNCCGTGLEGAVTGGASAAHVGCTELGCPALDGWLSAPPALFLLGGRYSEQPRCLSEPLAFAHHSLPALLGANPPLQRRI